MSETPEEVYKRLFEEPYTIAQEHNLWRLANHYRNQVAVLREAYAENMLTSFNRGVAAGILQNLADYCTDSKMKEGYLERMRHFQGDLKKITDVALAATEQDKWEE